MDKLKDEVTSTAEERSLTVGEAKKALEGLPDDYRLTWYNGFEDRYEWIRSLVPDSLTKAVYASDYGAELDDALGKERLRKKVVMREWIYRGRPGKKDSEKFTDAMAELEKLTLTNG